MPGISLLWSVVEEDRCAARVSEREGAATHGHAELHLDLRIQRHFGGIGSRADVQHGRCGPVAGLDVHSVIHGQSLRSRLDLHGAEAIGALEVTRLAVRLVALLTVTGPNAPAVAPPTEMPGPKLALVVPLAQFVNAPVTLTLSVCVG